MKRTTAAILALALGATVGTLGASTWARWSDSASATEHIGIGYSGFAVGHPGAPDTRSQAPRPSDTVTWTSDAGPAGNPLAALRTQPSVDMTVQVDAQSQGNRGLNYALSAVSLSGDRTLLDAADARIVAATTASGCTAALDGSAAELYRGPLAAARFTGRTLVGSAYSAGTWAAPNTEFLCIRLTPAPVDGQVHVNTATATGTYLDGTGTSHPLGDSDTWTARLGLPEAALTGTFQLSFTHSLFRG